MDEILAEIYEIVEAYKSGQYKDLYEGHRKLSCNMLFLARKKR